MTPTLPVHTATMLDGALACLAADATTWSAGDVARLVGALRIEQRAAEAVAARLHVLDLAIGSPYPIGIDAADEGLTDAVAQLAQTGLLRSVLLSAPAPAPAGGVDDTTSPVTARDTTAVASAVGDLRAAVDAIDAARRRVTVALADAHPVTVSSGRRSALARLVANAVPAALRAALA